MQLLRLHRLLQEEQSGLREHNYYRTPPCLALNGEEKVPAGCLALWPGAVLLLWGKCLIPGYNSWVLAFADLKGSEKGGEMPTAASPIALDVLLSTCAWNRSLDESTDCSALEQCEGEYCVKLSSLGMYVVQFFWLHMEL